MPFSWKDCTVLKNKSKDNARDCFKAIGKFKYCLTDNVTKGLEVWLYNKMCNFGSVRFTRERC